MHRLRTLFAFVCTSTALSAATLRVPEDYDRIQVAISMAAPGDTIAIGPGTFQENIAIRDSLTVRGAGVGKTILLAPNRQAPVITGELGGPIVISDLTVSHPPAPEGVKEPELYPFALHFSIAPVVLRNIRVENPSVYSIFSEFNLLTMENVSVVPTATNPVELVCTLPGTHIRDLTIGLQNWGTQIRVTNGAATFENLDPGLGSNSKIEVKGRNADVKFPGAPAAVIDRIVWDGGASPQGPQSESDRAYAAEAAAKRQEQQTQARTQSNAFRKVHVARRKLLQELHASLKKSTDSPQAIAALAAYLPKLYETAAPPAEDERGDGDTTLDVAVASELRALHARFGPAALAAAMELPSRYPDVKMVDVSEKVLSFDLRQALSLLDAEKWVKANVPDLPVLLSSWKKESPKDPAVAAGFFLEMLKAVSAKSAAAADNAKIALRNLALAELPAFTSKCGEAALDRLLRVIAAEPPGLITLDHVNSALTPEQKGALIRFWKSRK